MKKRYRVALTVAVIGAITFGGTQLLRPIGERIVGPIVKEQLNTAINGTASYDDFTIDWDGSVRIKNLEIDDEKGQRVATVPETVVTISPSEALKLPFTNNSGISLIRSVTLRQPNIILQETSSNTWNITTLIKKSDSSTSMDFRGLVDVEEAVVTLQMHNGRKVQITEGDGTLTFDEYPTIDGAVTAFVDGQQVQLRGSYTNDDTADFSLYVKANSIKLDYVNDLISSDVGATLTKGNAENIALTIARTNGRYRFDGNVNLKNVDATYTQAGKTYTARNGQAYVSLHDTVITITNGGVIVNDQPIFFRGTVNTKESSNPSLNLRVSAQDVDATAFGDYGVTGRISAVATIGGTVDKPTADGQVIVRDMQYATYSIREANANVSYDGTTITVPDFSVDPGSGAAKGTASYNTATGAYKATVSAVDVPLSLLQEQIGMPITGTVTGAVAVSGNSNESEPESIKANLKGTAISAQGITLDTAGMQLRGANGQYTIDYLNGTMGSGHFTAYGTASSEAVDLSFNGSDLPLSALQSYVGQPMDGVATVSGHVSGSLSNPNAVVKVASEGGQLAGMRYDQLFGDLVLKDKVATVKQGFVRVGHGYYSLSGTAHLTGDKALDLQAQAETVRIEDAAKTVTDLPITGWLSARARIRGTMANPDVRARIHAWDGSVYGKLFTDVDFGVSYQGDTLTIRNLTASAYGATFYGGGTMKGKALDFDVFGDKIYLAPWLKDYADVKGYVTAEGHLSGTTDRPIFEGTVGSDQISINGTRLTNIQGSVYVDPTVVNFQNISFSQGEKGKFTLQGGMTLTGEQRLFGYATIENGDLSSLIALTGVPIHNATGLISGRLDLGGNLKNPDIALKGTISELTAGHNLLGTSEVDVALKNRRLTVNSFQIPVGDGMLAAAGYADLDGETDIQIAANKVDVSLLTPLTGKEVPLTGTLNFIANVTGETKNPKVELSADMTNVLYNGVFVDRVYAMATMEDKIIKIQQLVGQRGQYKLKIYGDIPLAALYTSSYLPPGDKSAMDLVVDVNDADLAVLPLMMPLVTEGVGPLKGDVHITGSYTHPEANGTISVANGLIGFDGVKKELKNVNAQIRFTGTKAELLGGANMGKGTLGLSGDIAWSGTTLETYSGVVQFNNLELQHDYFKGPLNGEIGFVEKDGLPTVTGHIDLANNTIAIPLSFDTTGGGRPLGLDITVNVGKKVNLYSGGLYDITMKPGSAHIGGTTEVPNIEGKFIVDKGTIKYLNNSFRINKGEASFQPGSFLPYLDLMANAHVSSYQIMLGVKGPVDHMDLKLNSDPHLEERQIISLLTFGYSNGNSSELTSQDANALLAAGLKSALLGYVEGSMKGSLGLDLINITTGSLDQSEPINKSTNNYYNIEIGKYLLPNLMVTMSRGLNNSGNKYTLQYDINNHFSLYGTRTSGYDNSDAKSFVGVRWHSEF